MKTLLTLLVVLGTFQGLSAYPTYHDPMRGLDESMEKMHRDFDRIQNKVYQDDMIRLQTEANRINSQRGYRPGYGR